MNRETQVRHVIATRVAAALCAAILGTGPNADARAADPAARPHPIASATGMVLTGLVAERVERDDEGGPITGLDRVEISVHGTRITRMGIARGEPYLGSGQMLLNDDLERMWLIDRHRRIVHRVPLVASAGLPPASAPEPSRASTPGEVFAFAPCEGLRSDESAPSTWRGRPVTVHACRDAAGRVLSHQSFDASAGIVVRVVARGGAVQEVRSIRALALGPERFLPDESLREVELRELLDGAAPLARYDGG